MAGAAALAGGLGSVGIMEIQPGAKQPTVLKKGCGNVCHTASADGSTLVAATSLLGSAAYDLQTNVSTINAAANEHYTYGGLYPDGSFEMSATHYRTWISAPSRLYDTKTETNIPALGWDSVITNGGTTAFSPDGKQIAFVHEDENPRTIAAMDFSVGNHTFSNLVDIATDPSNSLAWPAFRSAATLCPLIAIANRLSMRLCACPCASLRRIPATTPIPSTISVKPMSLSVQ